MNLFSLATDGVDLDALPLEQSQQPRASFKFAEASEPARLRLPRELDDVFGFAAQEYGVDVDVLRGIAYAESRFNPDIISGKVKSPAGAIGLMQFMPDTAKEYGIDPTDPVQAIMGGAAYLRKSLDKFDGDYERAVASYNWGPNRKAYGSEDWASKAPQETQKYLMTVFGAVGKFKDGAAEQPAANKEPMQATPLPAGVAPSTAGGGRGSVSPGMVNTKLTRTAVPDMTVGSVAQDIGSGLLQVGPTAVKGVGELVRLATGDRLGQGITDFAERGIQATQDIVGSGRAAAQRQNLAADMADDSVSLGQAIASNKGALADQILPTLGSMAIPLGAAGVAGKAATVGRAAQGMSKAAMAARVASVQQAAGIGATAAQNAASTFAEMVDNGVSMPDAYKAAGITVPFSLIAGKLTGGGAEGALIKGLSGQSVARGAVELAKAPLREGAQEGGESLGQVAGEVLGAGQDVSLQSGIKRVGTEALLGAVVGGGMGAVQQIAAPRVESQPTTPQAPPVAPAAPAQSGTPPVAPTTPAAQGTADAIMELERRLQAAANPTAQPTADAGTTPVAPTGNAGATEGAGGTVAAAADGQPEQAQALSVPENFTATPAATVGTQTSVQAGPGFTGKGIAAEMAALRARSQPAPVATQPATQQAEQPRTTKAAQPAKANLDPQGLLSDDERQMLGEFTRLYQTDLKADIRQRLGMTPKEQATAQVEKKKPSALLSLIVQMGGIKSGLSADLTGANAMEGNRRHPGLFRNNGKQLDVLVQSLKERGYLTQADEDSILDNGGTNKLADMIQAELSGKRAKLVDNTDGFEAMRDADMRQGMEDKATALGLSQDMVNSMSDSRLNGTIKRIEARLGHPIKTDFATRKMSRAEARAEREAILMADRYERARAKYDAELQAFAEADDMVQDAVLDVVVDEDGNVEIVYARAVEVAAASDALNGTWSDQNAEVDTRRVGAGQENSGQAGPPVASTAEAGAGNPEANRSEASAGSQETLTTYTPEEVTAQQEAAEKAERTAKAKKQADDLSAKKEQERKEIAQASVAAADTFELAQDAMANLTGQRDVFGAPVAAQQTAGEAPAKRNATQTADATSKPDGVAGDAASRPTTHTNPVEYVAKLNREIPAKAPDEKPTPDTLRAAASIPTFQGGKTKMARAITEKVRQYWGGNASKIDTIIDYFGGSGSWGAYMAGAAFHNVKRLVIHEFNPDRLNKIRLFNDRGGDVEKLLSVPDVKAYFDAVSSAIDKKSTFSGTAIANVVADSNSRLKLRIAARNAVGADVFDGLLQAIQDQGYASFGKYGKGKSGSDAVDDILRRTTSNARQAYAQMQSLRERGVSIEYVTGNSYEAKQTQGKNVLAMVDPPYYATKGYNGVSLVGMDTYNDTRKLLDRLKSAGNSVIYTDEAWWEKHDKKTGRTIVPPDSGKQVDGLDAFGQLSSIKGLMGDFFRMPIATRMEVVGFIDGNRNAGTIGRSSSADDRQAQRAWQAGEDAGGLVAGTGRQAGGGMAERDGRVSEGQPAKPGRLNPSTGAGKADSRNSALTSVVRNGGNSTAVLTDIAKNSTNPAFRLVAKAILAKGLPFDLRIRTDFTDGKVAHYSTDGHFVEFDPGMPFNLEQVLLHEAVHAVTAKYVASFGDSTPLGKELAALFKLSEQHAKKTGAKFYGLTNADEFLAEVMTNADFAQWLDTVPVPLQKSALSRFVRAVARFFGIQKADGATTQAMDVFERIMRAQSDLQAEASQKLSTSKDASKVADAYGVDTEEDGDSVYFGDAEVSLNREDNTYIVTSENEFTPDHRAAVAWAENNGFASELAKIPSAKLTPVESMLRDALEATGDMGAAKDMAYEALRRQGVSVKWQDVVDAARKIGRGTRASKPGMDAIRSDTDTSPRTPASTIRAAITKAYGNLLDKLEGKGLVTIAQTEREAIEAAAQARADKTGGDVEQIKRQMLASVQMQRVWHGTPHRFDKFSTEFMGKGEGAQAFGWGLYYASKREIAESYRGTLTYRDMVRKFRNAMPDDASIEDASEWADSGDAPKDMARVIKALSADDWLGFDYPAQALTALFKEPANFDISKELADAAKAMQGQLYEVEIPEDGDMLLWDKPLSEQPENVLAALRRGYEEQGGDYPDKSATPKTGREIYNDFRALAGGFESMDQRAASEYLASLGIKGIKYLDGTSRNAGDGSYNYVIFDGADTQIVDVKYSANGNIEGFFDRQTGKSFLVADNLTASSAPGTLMHEVGIHMAAGGKLEPLFNRAAQLLKLNKNNPFLQRVQARMDQSGETSAEEAAAYIVTEYENDRVNAPASVAQWVKDFIADVRAWLFGKGVLLKADQLTVADIAAVARANAKSMARGGPNGGPGGGQAFSKTPDARPIATRAEFTGKRSPLTGKPTIDLFDAGGSRIETSHIASTTAEALENYRLRPERQAAAQASAPAQTYAIPDAKAKDQGSNWRRVRGQEFTSTDESDEYLYHVTSEPSAKGVRSDGLTPNSGGMFGGFYANYSAGKVFVTERGGVSYWMDKVGQQLESAMDNPPPVVVLRIQKSKIKASLQPDVIGGRDANAPAFYATETVFSRTALPATLNIDGKGRPTTNSKGQPIHPTEEGVRNFWRWFSDSRVVDEQGRPLVVYHGTGGDFDTFDGFSHWGSATPALANDYAGFRGMDGESVSVMPIYMRAESAFDADKLLSAVKVGEFFTEMRTQALAAGRKVDDKKAAALIASIRAAASREESGPTYSRHDFWHQASALFGRDGAAQVKELFAMMGFDSVKLTEDGSLTYGVLSPTQIKSATGNTGAFSPTDPDIRRSISNRAQQPLFNQTPAHTWEELGESYVDTKLYNWQDDRIDLKRVQESITKAGRQIDDQFDARTAETLLPGRLAKRTEDFMAVEAAPLLKDMAKNNVTMEEVSDYMLARHAPERNAQIAKVNPDMPDAGSGTNSEGVLMTTQAANDHIAALTTGKRMVLEMLARRVDAITKGTRDLLVAEGLEKAETIRAWEGAYKHYVPLFRDEAANTPGHPVGSGISVTGSSSKRATGSTKEVTNMLAHVLMQREAAITRAEKNRVGMSLYGMALSHPNKAFWSTVQPKMSTADIVAELQRMGVDPMDGIMGMDAAPTIRTVDDRTGLVVDRPNPMYKKLDNAIVVKVNGEDRVILFNTKNERAMRMAESLKNQHFDQGMWVNAANTVAPVTRFMSAMMTQYNPAFGMVNAVRDVQGALVNLSSTPLNGKQARVLADTPAAVIGIARDIRGDGKRTPWSDLWVQFQEDGGRTGYRDLVVSPYERAANMEKDIKRMQQEGKWTPGNAAHAVLDLLGDFNDSLENGVRLAAYKAALDKGMTRPQAAKLARELTVDFNRKGRKGRELGKLYAFLNASIQGNARNIATVMGAHGGKVLAGGFALGVLQALMLAAAGYEDDEIREFQKARALIIPIGGKQHITIPMALGFHVIPNTSRILTELMLTGGKDWQTKVPEAMFEIANAANPFGGGGDWKTAHGPLTMVMPTAGDWAVDLAMNRDFTGNQISRTRYNERNPGSAIARESTLRTPSGQVYQGISKAINDLTGGSDRKAGAVSPTPEELRYIMGVVGGGVYRETEKALNAAVMLASGDEIKATQVPLGSRFMSEVRDEDVQRSRYYKNSRKLEDLEADLKDAAKDRDSAKMNELRQDKLTNAIGLNNAVQRHITQINKMAKDDIGDKAAMAQHDANRAAAMRRLNDEVLKLEKQAQ